MHADAHAHRYRTYVVRFWTSVDLSPVEVRLERTATCGSSHVDKQATMQACRR